jgi:redox-sensitive bicupin YhaK (pirin superfamily)
VTDHGRTVRVVAGSLLGQRSPIKPLWDTLFADIALTAGANIPIDAVTEERALYVVDGEIDIVGDRFAPGQLLIFRPGDAITVTATRDARVTLFGGAAMDGPRHVWWNFVSSRKDRIEQAKADWRAGRFDSVPGDTEEFIPLPE